MVLNQGNCHETGLAKRKKCFYITMTTNDEEDHARCARVHLQAEGITKTSELRRRKSGNLQSMNDKTKTKLREVSILYETNLSCRFL